MRNLQLGADGGLRHFLTIEGLDRALLTEILDTAESVREAVHRRVRKLPLLRGKTVINLFFEPSTRTRTTFELAARRLSAEVVNINVDASSTTKGESLLDTLQLAVHGVNGEHGISPAKLLCVSLLLGMPIRTKTAIAALPRATGTPVNVRFPKSTDSGSVSRDDGTIPAR